MHFPHCIKPAEELSGFYNIGIASIITAPKVTNKKNLHKRAGMI